MILDLKYQHRNFIKDVVPYICGGIFIDTSVMKPFLDGFINLRFSSKLDESYQDLLDLFDFLKVNNRWEKFLVTPHIFTEICSHLHRDYNKQSNYKEIVAKTIPILSGLNEDKVISKNEILDCIDLKKPIIEIGDVSIFLTAEKLTKVKKKTSILVSDSDFNDRYKNDPYVLVIDFGKTVLDLKQIK